MRGCSLALLILLLLIVPAVADENVRAENVPTAALGDVRGDAAPPPGSTPYILPKQQEVEGDGELPQLGVQWDSLFRHSLTFLAWEHGFRLMTEPGTRDGMKGPFFDGYLDAVKSLHGWSDGDPFYVNYIGHPMQGSVAGYIWSNNDPQYHSVTFGRDPRYWKSRLRATGYSFLYSEQFEIGLLSESSIGKIQSRYPQQGLVDQVVTPVFGLGWMIAEDALDRYVIEKFERKVQNPYLRILVRGALNPSRVMGNLAGFKVPWYRTSRHGVFSYRGKEDRYPSPKYSPVTRTEPYFQLEAPASFLRLAGSDCIGAGGAAALRLSDSWDGVLEVSGCQLLGLPGDWSGDSLLYAVGPRWVGNRSSRWATHSEFLVGGHKITRERIDRDKRDALLAKRGSRDNPQKMYEQYAERVDAHGLALKAGAGVDLKVSEAFALRVAKVDYLKSWTGEAARDYDSGFRFSTGFLLRLGTW